MQCSNAARNSYRIKKIFTLLDNLQPWWLFAISISSVCVIVLTDAESLITE